MHGEEAHHTCSLLPGGGEKLVLIVCVRVFFKKPSPEWFVSTEVSRATSRCVGLGRRPKSGLPPHPCLVGEGKGASKVPFYAEEKKRRRRRREKWIARRRQRGRKS